jgi:hypothetical protein
MKKKFKEIHLFLLIIGIVIFISAIFLNKCDGSCGEYLFSSQKSTDLNFENIVIPKFIPESQKILNQNKTILLSTKNNEDTIVEFYGRNFIVYTVSK